MSKPAKSTPAAGGPQNPICASCRSRIRAPRTQPSGRISLSRAARERVYFDDLFEPRLAPPTTDDVRLALGSHVLHPFAVPAHPVSLAPLRRPRECGGVGSSSSPTYLSSGRPRDAPHRPEVREMLYREPGLPDLVKARN